jgi:hypothetical protein
MNEAWFDASLYAWIPGTLLGVLGGTWGGLSGVLAPQGKAKGFVMGCWGVLMVYCLVLLVAGVVALAQGQPYGIWYGLGFPGLLGLLLLGSLIFVVRLRYQQAEARRMQAKDLGS